MTRAASEPRRIFENLGDNAEPPPEVGIENIARQVRWAPRSDLIQMMSPHFLTVPIY
jgi:hypothetical protein